MTPEEHAALDLYVTFEVGPHSDHFTAELYRLISKADWSNKSQLALSYPLHVSMHQEWMETEDRFAFYEKYNCITNHTPFVSQTKAELIERAIEWEHASWSRLCSDRNAVIDLLKTALVRE